ncbi:hypothetical protein ACLK17_23505 [Escherichia coli]
MKALVYGMLHLAVEQDIRSRYAVEYSAPLYDHIDQAQRVAKVAANFFDQVERNGNSKQ